MFSTSSTIMALHMDWFSMDFHTIPNKWLLAFKALRKLIELFILTTTVAIGFEIDNMCNFIKKEEVAFCTSIAVLMKRHAINGANRSVPVLFYIYSSFPL